MRQFPLKINAFLQILCEGAEVLGHDLCVWIDATGMVGRNGETFVQFDVSRAFCPHSVEGAGGIAKRYGYIVTPVGQAGGGFGLPVVQTVVFHGVIVVCHPVHQEGFAELDVAFFGDEDVHQQVYGGFVDFAGVFGSNGGAA